MNEEIQSLVEGLRRGDHEDPQQRIALLVAALREAPADTKVLLGLMQAPQLPLRLAAVEAAADREEEEIKHGLRARVHDPEPRVRAQVAKTLAQGNEASDIALVQSMMQDADSAVRLSIVEATPGKPAFLELHREALTEDSNWEVRRSAAQALFRQRDATIAFDLLRALAMDEDEDVQRACAECLEKSRAMLEKGDSFLAVVEKQIVLGAERNLKSLGGRYEKLWNGIRQVSHLAVDVQVLAKFGTDLTAAARTGLLPHACGFKSELRVLVDLFQRDSRRSVALIGDSGVGKSALVQELTYELTKSENGGWTVLRMSPTDFMAGTRYLGEWETRVRELVESIRKPRRVILYIPNLSDLQSMGRWEKSDANVATALAPYLEDGSLVVLGESTPEEFERSFGRIPSLQRLFDKVLVQESSPEATRDALREVCHEAKADISGNVLDRLLELTGFFLSHVRRPGSAIGLLRAVLESRRDPSEPVSERRILEVLSRSTGIPVDLLDDTRSLRATELRNFFEQRILGQAEAVDAVVDLILLIKAGLTDPAKPFGSYLFIGPTGVGKTELARALAEFIFGDAKRLVRFDMSEFAHVEGFERLIGHRGENGLLTDAVRQQPFSVVLLDEIEKSHVNVFDLLLQLLDAGRLTDGRGRLVDFRRTIVILTSNIGAQAPGTTLGFGASSLADSAAQTDPDRTWRELSRFFRPEFLNRLDRILHFRPLSLEVAERIARRELDLVVQRSGIVRRGLVVTIDPAVVSLLVREGYSPHFGARPLKRTVERLLLAPLARTLAEGQQAPRSVLSVEVKQNRVVVRSVAAPQLQPAAGARSAPSEAVPPAPLAGPASISLLESELEGLQEQVRPLMERKSELVIQTRASGFYADPVQRTQTFEEIHRLDQFLDLMAGLTRAVQGLEARWKRTRGRREDEAQFEQHLAAVAADLKHASLVARSTSARELGDAFMWVSLVNRVGETQQGVEQLVRMYLGWATRKRMTASVVGEFYSGKQDQALLHVAGLGAYSLLQFEAGLHQLDHRYRQKSPRSGKEKTFEDREVIRVEVFPASGEPNRQFLSDCASTWRELKPKKTRLVEQAAWWGALFHNPSLRSLDIWMQGSREGVSRDALQILHAVVTGSPATEGEGSEIVRYYDLGIGSRIKDVRSGRTTSRIAHVLKGDLSGFGAKD